MNAMTYNQRYPFGKELGAYSTSPIDGTPYRYWLRRRSNVRVVSLDVRVPSLRPWIVGSVTLLDGEWACRANDSDEIIARAETEHAAAKALIEARLAATGDPEGGAPK